MHSSVQRAQLALTLAIAKRPDLLVLDEPVASLDPLTRREFCRALWGSSPTTTPASSSPGTWRVCDYLVVLADSRLSSAPGCSVPCTWRSRLGCSGGSPEQLVGGVPYPLLK